MGNGPQRPLPAVDQTPGPAEYQTAGLLAHGGRLTAPAASFGVGPARPDPSSSLRGLPGVGAYNVSGLVAAGGQTRVPGGGLMGARFDSSPGGGGVQTLGPGHYDSEVTGISPAWPRPAAVFSSAERWQLSDTGKVDTPGTAFKTP